MKPNTNQPHISPPTRGCGFTLIELLVVITIIVVLAAVIFAVTRNIRSRAYQANAMSSLRQVSDASVAYTIENNGDINTMRYSGSAKEASPSWVKNTFWGRLQPYLFPAVTSSDSAFRREVKQGLDQLFSTNTDAGNSADPKGKPMPGTIVSGSRMYRDTSGLAIPFAFNAKLAPWTQFAKTSDFGDPGRIIYAVYGYGMFDEADGRSYVPRPTDNKKPANNIYYLDDKKALAAFLDGHIDMVSPPIRKQNLE